MSNRVNIITTKFIDTADQYTSYGVRIFDDYLRCYNNCWDKIPDSPREILRKAYDDCTDNAEIAELFDFVLSQQKDVYVNDICIPYEDVVVLLL